MREPGRRRFRTVRVLRAVFANPSLRRVDLAYLLFVMAKWGTRVAIFVFAYQRGGAVETGLVAVIQLVPAAIVAPLASVVGDRIRRDRALTLGYAVQSVAAGAVAAALLVGAPVPVVYSAAAVLAAGMTLTRPVQSALFPQVTRSPDELIAQNVVAGMIYSAMTLAGPATAGALIALRGPGPTVAVFAVVLFGSMLLVARLEPQPAPAPSGDRPIREAAAGFRALAREPHQRLVVGLMVAQSVIAGALDVLLVVIALGLLGLPPSGVGYLAAARGAGGLLGGLWAMGLVGRPHLAAALALGLLVYGLGTVALAFAAVAVLSAGFLVVAGSGYARADMAGRILLQRVVPGRLLARVFGVLEGVNQAGLAAGAALAPLLVGALGLRGGILAAGLLLPLGILLLGARIRAVDRAARVPERELALLRSVDLFAPLPAPTLEGIVSRLVRVDPRPGSVVMREGDPGDRFYIVVEGEVVVARNGREVTRLGPGDYFGEIALLRDVPRTATVTTVTEATLLALERVDFLEAVTGHPLSREAADLTVGERMPNE